MTKKQQLESAKNRAYMIVEKLNSDLENGIITEDEWFDKNNSIFTESYLAGDNPGAQSGHGGDEKHYVTVHSMILPAIYKNGTFIDVGCANGYLIESLKKWTDASGFQIDFYGLDISERLLDLAKKRLLHWRDNLFPGNALFFKPEKKFDFVLIRELGYVPKNRELDLIKNLFTNFLKEGGRFIIGPYTIEKDNFDLKKTFYKAGYVFSGYTEQSHNKYNELCRRLFWIDTPPNTL